MIPELATIAAELNEDSSNASLANRVDAISSEGVELSGGETAIGQ